MAEAQEKHQDGVLLRRIFEQTKLTQSGVSDKSPTDDDFEDLQRELKVYPETAIEKNMERFENKYRKQYEELAQEKHSDKLRPDNLTYQSRGPYDAIEHSVSSFCLRYNLHGD